MSSYVLPYLAANHVLDDGCRDAVLNREQSRADATLRVSESYVAHGLVRQLRSLIALPLVTVAATLRPHVHDVFLLCAKEKMIRIHARLHVASVANLLAVGNLAVTQLPRETMRLYGGVQFVDPEMAVSRTGDVPDPKPAPTRSVLVDFSPEPILSGFLRATQDLAPACVGAKPSLMPIAGFGVERFAARKAGRLFVHRVPPTLVAMPGAVRAVARRLNFPHFTTNLAQGGAS